jgi:hypothetical protein
MVLKHKYIIRQDNYWRCKIRIGQRTLSKCYAFSKYGGIKSSLNMAIAWRDLMLAKHGLLSRLDYIKAPDLYSTKEINVIGVYLIHSIQNDMIWWNWTARYSIDGVEHKRRFSVNKYGTVEAFQLACAIRYHYCGVIIILNKNAIPALPLVPYKVRKI